MRANKKAYDPKHRIAGFGILEAIVTMAAILVLVVAVNQGFLNGKRFNVTRKTDLHIQEDLNRLMMVTEENTVCEKLNFVRNSSLGGINKITKINEISLDGHLLTQVGSTRTVNGKVEKMPFRVDKIELRQQSNVFSANPWRAKGEINIEYTYLDPTKNFQPVPGRDAGGLRKYYLTINLMLASATGPGGAITSCYGSFSRRIACEDENLTFVEGRVPNCK